MEKLHFPPIFFLSLAYICGLALADFLELPLLALFISTLLCLSLVILLFWFKKGPKFSLVFSLILFFLLGMVFNTYQKHSLKNSLLLDFARKGKYAELAGRIVTEPRIRGEKVTFSFKVNHLREGREAWKIEEWTKVNIDGFNKFPYKLGDKLRLEGYFLSSKNLPNSDFSYQNYLYRQKIQTLFVVDSSAARKIAPPNVLISLANSARERIRQGAHRFLRGDKEGLLLGILIGDTSRISAKAQEDFRTTGLTHILAVSGQNVGMLILISLLLFRLVKVKPAVQAGLITLMVIFYALVTQSQPSVLRASLMVLVGVAAWLLGRQKSLISALSATALALLLYEPFLLYNISFQLSFLATLAIILFLPIIQVKIEKMPRGLRSLVAVSLAAQLGVAPILIYYFNQLSLVSLLANVLVVPVTAVVLGLGLLGSFLAYFSPLIAFPFYGLLNLLLSYIDNTAHLLALLPGAAIFTKSPHLLGILGYYLLLGGFLLNPRPKRLNFPSGVFAILLLILMSGAVWWGVFQNAPSSRLKAIFFDVGQGDATLVQTPEGNNILIDGGENPFILLKKLRIRGVKTIDLVILSHPHLDHVGGLVEVVERYPVGLVLDSGQAHPSFQYQKFLEAIKKRKIPYKLARKGDRLSLGRLKILIFHPKGTFITGTDSDLNNNSVVAKLVYEDFSLFFPGDAQIEAEEVMLNWKGSLSSTLLKVPHQGSTDAANMDFLKKVRPKVAIIPVGKNNSYGHPAQSTLRKLRFLGATTYRTDEYGTITVTSDEKNYQVLTERGNKGTLE